MVTVYTLSLCTFNALIAAQAVSSALRFSNLQMMVSASQSPMRFFLIDNGGAVFYADAVGHFASGPCAAVAFAVGFSLALFGKTALPLGFFGAILLPLGTVPFDFATDGSFVSVKLFGDSGDGSVAGQIYGIESAVV